MAVVNLTSPYDQESAKIARSQKYAEMLQQQAMAPEQTFSYNGIQAPIPKSAGLAKILQGLTGVYMQNKADEDTTANYEENARKPAEAFMNEMRGPLVPGTPEVGGVALAGRSDVDDQDFMRGKPGGPEAPMAIGASMPTAGGMGFGGSAATPDSYKTPSAEQAQQLYIKAMTGGFGPIAGQVAPVLYASQQKSDLARLKIDAEAERARLANEARIKAAEVGAGGRVEAAKETQIGDIDKARLASELASARDIAGEARKQQLKENEEIESNKSVYSRIQAQTPAHLKDIDKLLNRTDLEDMVGSYEALIKANLVPSSKQMDFKNQLDKIAGGAFLTSFGSLRGGGQISNAEGTKATQAAFNANQSGSVEAFKENLKAYRDSVERQLKIAKGTTLPRKEREAYFNTFTNPLSLDELLGQYIGAK